MKRNIAALLFMSLLLYAAPGFALPGDLNENAAIDIEDAILSLQVAAGLQWAQKDITNKDVNGDLTIGLAEAIFALRTVASPPPAGTFRNSLDMTFVSVPAGTFDMGSPESEIDRDADEIQHQVTISNPFHIQTTEVTQGQWEAVMGGNPSLDSTCGADCPVERVSWNYIQQFIQELNALEEGAYRLPTEAEWEYAARAGSTTAFANGPITAGDRQTPDPVLDLIGWYFHNADGHVHPVAQKQSNDWGIFDMHGNLWEWCQDWYGAYPTTPITDPNGPASGSMRVIRSGGRADQASWCRSAERNKWDPAKAENWIGFRLVVTPP